jgi:NADPH-dependent 2,4-dienoyl-CoA reductase/sulfur reductase-like enzyme
VLLVDEQAQPGGLIYHHVTRASSAQRDMLGPDYDHGLGLCRALEDVGQGLHTLDDGTVWQLAKVGERVEVGISTPSGSRLVRAPEVIVATGALERPFPIPGWTLPGVMMAGGAQLLLKSSGMVANGAVFAGTGPLLYAVVWQYLQAGARVRAVLDTTPWWNYFAAAPRVWSALRCAPILLKGLKLLANIKGAGVPLISGVRDVVARGKDQLESVAYVRGWRGRNEHIDAEHLLLHQGVVPNVNLTTAAGCEHVWDASQLCFRPLADSWGRSTVEGINIAGDAVSVSGALSAEYSGTLVALGVAQRLGVIDEQQRDQYAVPAAKALRVQATVRPFLERLYRPRDELRVPSRDEVTVCRCEEVTAGQLREALALGHSGPNQLKSDTRCGMGACQGRMCGLTVTELTAKERGVAPGAAGYFRLRAPAKPITLGELASLHNGDAVTEGNQQ